ncbi:MAG: transcription termination/antitermination protein NusA [Anaerolineales bacterium]|uniref:transcription termination factor NusA n=1 Tax=Candidatus Villigracilis proximus TaxID=3140683 RepID=UPI003135DF36|nr:transcription termination/antitermination protein NusA [Anaerolineales bacterium]
MAKNEFALAFNEVLEEKQLAKDVVVAAIESAMVSAYRRAVSASTAQHVEAKLDPDTGIVTVFAEKEVVEDNIVDDRTEVLLEVARKVNPEAQLGDMVVVETTPADFGRVAAQTARQVIQQRIREAERSNQMQYFERQVGEIVSGLVQAINAQGSTIGLDMKAEGVMPNNQKIPGERLKLHDRIRAVVMEVKDGTRGPQIVLSRAHRNFLRRLLENEVPEIYHGIVEIRAISREPGARAKVAVSATQPGIDPVGACVGIKGVRIQAIVKELHDEKIDIIQWDQDPIVYISKAISPARVNGVYLADNEGARTATVVVGEDQLSLAIGRDGQNARLAAKLTGWRIDIKSLSEAAGDSLRKLQGNAELSAMLPAAMEAIPQIEEILAKKAENRPIMPEEYTVLGQFVDRVERRTIQIKEEAAREVEERTNTARAEVPAAAFQMPLEQAGLKEHIFNILTEAGFETIGNLIFSIKTDPNKVLGLPGIGSKAMQNIEEVLAALTFPEPEPVKVEEPVASIETVAAEPVAVPVAGEEMPAAKKQADGKKDAKRVVEVEEELAKDGVNLDELFKMKPEIFQSTGPAEEESSDKKKAGGKKGKKKAVELEFDEGLGTVVGRKIHKRGDSTPDNDWE